VLQVIVWLAQISRNGVVALIISPSTSKQVVCGITLAIS
jgi:hypothetical protein